MDVDLVGVSAGRAREIAVPSKNPYCAIYYEREGMGVPTIIVQREAGKMQGYLAKVA
jgi:hypothetical protein